MESFPQVQIANCLSDAGLSSRSRSPAFGRGTMSGKEIRCGQAAGHKPVRVAVRNLIHDR